jgi:hypothetical protein
MVVVGFGTVAAVAVRTGTPDVLEMGVKDSADEVAAPNPVAPVARTLQKTLVTPAVMILARSVVGVKVVGTVAAPAGLVTAGKATYVAFVPVGVLTPSIELTLYSTV